MNGVVLEVENAVNLDKLRKKELPACQVFEHRETHELAIPELAYSILGLASDEIENVPLRLPAHVQEGSMLPLDKHALDWYVALRQELFVGHLPH